MPVLSYYTPPGRRPVLAVVVLWIWAVVDVAVGMAAATGAIVAVFLPIGPWPVMLALAVAGVGLAVWGIETGAAAVQVYRIKPGAAERAHRMAKAAVWIGCGGYAAIAGLGVTESWKGGWAYPLWSLVLLVPHTLVMGAIVQTTAILKRARHGAAGQEVRRTDEEEAGG